MISSDSFNLSTEQVESERTTVTCEIIIQHIYNNCNLWFITLKVEKDLTEKSTELESLVRSEQMRMLLSASAGGDALTGG